MFKELLRHVYAEPSHRSLRTHNGEVSCPVGAHALCSRRLGTVGELGGRGVRQTGSDPGCPELRRPPWNGAGVPCLAVRAGVEEPDTPGLSSCSGRGSSCSYILALSLRDTQNSDAQGPFLKLAWVLKHTPLELSSLDAIKVEERPEGEPPACGGCCVVGSSRLCPFLPGRWHSGWHLGLEGARALGSSPGPATWLLCDFGQVTKLL